VAQEMPQHGSSTLQVETVSDGVLCHLEPVNSHHRAAQPLPSGLRVQEPPPVAEVIAARRDAWLHAVPCAGSPSFGVLAA
jgi:hypothetical protein